MARTRRTLDIRVQNRNLSRYLKEIGDFEPLSSEREAELAARIKKGDAAALEELVKANLRFVVSVARNYENQGLPLSDLINEGNIGLVRAAHRFDETKNFRFISYAVWWIRQAILQALAQHSRIIRLPLNSVGKVYRLYRARERLAQRYRRTPNEQELSEELGMSDREFKTVSKIHARHRSLDEPVGTQSFRSLSDTIADGTQDRPDEEMLETSFRREVGETLQSRLSEKERFVVARYFGIGQDADNTLEEIGDALGLTRERVRQMKDSALQKLRDCTRTQKLRQYVA